jgi:hypothetical protein
VRGYTDEVRAEADRLLLDEEWAAVGRIEAALAILVFPSPNEELAKGQTYVQQAQVLSVLLRMPEANRLL